MSPEECRPDLPTPEELLDGHPPAPGTSRAGTVSRPRAAASPVRRKKRRGCVWGVLMILIVAVGVTAAVLDMRKRSRSDSAVRSIVSADAAFSGVERRTVRNEHAGPLMVVTGNVRNAGRTACALMVTARLHDKDGASLAHGRAWAGLRLTDKQLRTLDKADLEAALGAARSIKAPPGDDVPFTILFYEIPAGVAGCALAVDGQAPRLP